MKVKELDFESLEDFPLKWRWTDALWNKLPDEDLDKIRPLTSIEAAKLDEYSNEFVGDGGLLDTKFIDIDRIETSSDEETVNRWLGEKSDDNTQEIIVSWDKQLAVMIDWGTFRKYWDDFCYPASDDVAIFPTSAAWILFYFHDEYFEFGSLKT